MLADLFDHLVEALHLGRNADQAAKARAGSQLLAKNAILVVQLDALNQPLDLGAQLLHMERLGYIIFRPQPCGSHGRLDGPVLREYHHRGIRLGRADALQKLQPSQLGHLQIGHHDVEGRLSSSSSASVVVDAVWTSSPISAAMSRHNARVASSSSTIRIEKPVAGLLALAGLASTCTKISSTAKARSGPKRPVRTPYWRTVSPGELRLVYTRMGIMSIDNRTEAEASPRGS